MTGCSTCTSASACTLCSGTLLTYLNSASNGCIANCTLSSGDYKLK